ncbi:MAG TPA: DUF5684 domain-containing protein [Terriglobales bacterium]|jgi:hypothetical protein|nr:DUF5684 domain-containing protein [Terriglobales bacterium]
MKARLNRLSLSGLGVALGAVFVSSSAAWGQSSSSSIPPALAGSVLMIALVCGFAAYIYMGLALQTIALKTNTANGWLAWVPIANAILMLQIAKKPLWWIILFMIPVVNIVIIIMVWMGVAEARQKPNWWGILAIVPLVNMVVPGYLAWSD